MRALVLFCVLAVSLAWTAPASAASGGTWHATFATGGVTGTVTVSISDPSSGGRLTENLSGLHPHTLAVLWLRSGKCSSAGFGATRLRWTVPASGHRTVTASMTPTMAHWFMYDWTHRGGVHASLVDASTHVCVPLVAG